jgi:hypothetical protein
MPVIRHGDGLHNLYVGTAGKRQANPLCGFFDAPKKTGLFIRVL